MKYRQASNKNNKQHQMIDKFQTSVIGKRSAGLQAIFRAAEQKNKNPKLKCKSVANKQNKQIAKEVNRN
tara:strand:+ start:412 stop:618 length:207 start_codon:yes stop_codon:yes gene_type:complete